MSELPARADVVVIGAGIVGNCLVGHLADLGWTDIVQVDKGPLPNPGGSTGHASNFIFPTDHNREMALLTVESQRQYEAAGLSTTCGGIEIARSQERMEELRRRMTSAKAYGIEASLLTPSEVKGHLPFINEEIVVGGFYTPSVSVVDSLGFGTMMREKAQAAGALKVFANTEVTALELAPVLYNRPRIVAVGTDRGRIESDRVVIACGVWSPRVARMAGASIPLTPAVHQMVDAGPVEILQATGNEIGYPIVRDMDTFTYERQSAGSMEIGSYAHRPILQRPDDIPSIDEAALSPTEMPFTAEDFDPQLEDALDLMGEILETAEIRYAVNGLISLTPDTMPVLGETVEVDGLWSAAAVWVKEGPGIARLIAEWMTYGYPHFCDPHGSDVARFYPHERTERHIEARASEHFNKTYGIVHPSEQWESERGLMRSPFYAREQALGAVFYEARGWERPHWYESNADLVEHYGVEDRDHEWDRRWWSPIIDAEHLRLREKAAMVDLSAFQIYEVTGPGAVDYVQRMTVNHCDVAVGRSVYTPLLNRDGGFRSDLTVVRVADDRFRIVTGVFDGGRDEYWFRKHLPFDGSVDFENRTSALSTIGLWGPEAPAILAPIVDGDITDTGLRFGSVKQVVIAGVAVEMLRISYVGDRGWEIYVPTETAPAVWDAVYEAGRGLDLRPAGIGVYGTTGRIEKGYRLMGAELESEYTPVEAGLARPRVKSAHFVGKDAYLAAREAGTDAMLCTLVMESQRSAAGIDRYPLGGNEPILTTDGERIVDARGRVSRVTTAGAAPTLGAYLLMAYLPPEHAVEGARLQVMYMNERYPVTVARVGSTPLFDPENSRMRG